MTISGEQTAKGELQAAVDDLLVYCREPGRLLGKGLELRSVLLDQPSGDNWDAPKLALALETLIMTAIEGLRRNAGLIPLADDSQLPVMDLLRRDIEANNERLEILSLVWAHYLQGLSKAVIAEIYPLSLRSVETRLARGREEVARLITRKAAERSSVHPLVYEPDSDRQELRWFHVVTTAQEQRNRQMMIEKVRSFWIAGVPTPALHAMPPINMDMVDTADAVTHAWDDVIPHPIQTAQPVPCATSIIDIFDQLAGELLILGAPGSGKTITLLTLTQELLQRSERQPENSLPVIFNLSSWAEQRQPLALWLTEELNIRYGIPRKLGRVWIDSDQLLLLLDGLDEVKEEHRAACIEVINAFHQDHGLSKVVVCSRSENYMRLPMKLRLRGAIELQPLTSAQIDAYVEEHGTNATGIRHLLKMDQALQEVAQTPLFLNILIKVYRDLHINNVLESVTSEQLHAHLFDAYIQHMLARRSQNPRYVVTTTQRWLSWLAQAMQQHEQRIFHIEQLQSDWLPADVKWHYIRTIGLVRGVLVGIAIGVLAAPSFLLAVQMSVLGVFQLIGPHHLLISAILGGLIGGAIFGWIGLSAANPLKTEPILVVEVLNWSRATTRSALIVGGVAGGIYLLGIGLAYGLPRGLLFGITVSLALGGLILIRGMTGDEVEHRSVPNQGIRRSAFNAVRIGLSVGLIVGLCLVLVIGLTFGAPIGRVFGPAFGGSIGFMMLLFYGGEACIKHYILRYMLYRHNCMPLKYIDFLNDAVKHGLLCSTGSGYIFFHPLLQQHFATLSSRATD